MPDIQKAGIRKGLPARREPHWQTLEKGQALGFRKLESGSETWIARRRTDAGGHEYESLGKVTDEFNHAAALAKAREWFHLRETGINTGEVVTVADACRRYVEERGTEKTAANAHDAKKRFERTVYDNHLGKIALTKLRSAHIKKWRADLGLKPAAANRTLTTLKAALYLAVNERHVPASATQEWREVKPLPGGDSRRELILDLAQRRALLDVAKGAVRDLLEAALLTGARPGEVVSLTRGKFDACSGTIEFGGKTGRRKVPLSPAGIVLFTRLAKSKLPAARLLTRDDGKPWAHSDWDELVRETASAAELPKGVVLYTMRHCFITTALMSGMATLEVSRLVGTSVQMIEKHYGHLIADETRERLAKVQMV